MKTGGDLGVAKVNNKQSNFARMKIVAKSRDKRT